MPDLADRISHGAVAALDLAPFDDRFGRLSRQVLAGGASRFARVTADDQAVHFVIPVGVAGDRIDYGALVIQDRQLGLLWRDASGMDHSVTVPRGPGATSSWSTVDLGGEQWSRFDVSGAGQAIAFLVPPVNSPRLQGTLVDFLAARPGPPRPLAPLHAPEPEPVAVRFPDPEPDAGAEAQPEPGPETDPEAASGPDTTLMMAAVDADPTIATVPHDTPAADAGGAGAAVDENGPQFAPDPAELSQWEADAPTVAAGGAAVGAAAGAGAGGATPAADAPTAPIPAQATTPMPAQATTPMPAQATTPMPAQAAAGGAPFDLYRDQAQAPAPPMGGPPPSAGLRSVSAAEGYAAVVPGPSLTLRGFLIGLFATLAAGGVLIVVRLMAG